jgi:hypothetical protein
VLPRLGGQCADRGFACGSGQYREEQGPRRAWWSRSGRWEPSIARCHRAAVGRPSRRYRCRTFSVSDVTELAKYPLAGPPPVQLGVPAVERMPGRRAGTPQQRVEVPDPGLTLPQCSRRRGMR